MIKFRAAHTQTHTHTHTQHSHSDPGGKVSFDMFMGYHAATVMSASLSVGF